MILNHKITFTILIILLLLFAPISPWYAALSVLLHTSPLYIPLSIYLYHWTIKTFTPETTALRQHFYIYNHHIYVQIFLAVAIITSAFIYNIATDDSQPMRHTSQILKAGPHGKGGGYATIANPNKPPLFFFKDQTIDVKIRRSDYYSITAKHNLITITFYKGSLSMPWMHDKDYILKDIPNFKTE